MQFSPTRLTSLTDNCKLISWDNFNWQFRFNVLSGLSTVPHSHNRPSVYPISKMVKVVHFMPKLSNLKVLLKGSGIVTLMRGGACFVQFLLPGKS